MVNLNICSTSAVVNNANKVQAHLQEVLRYACMHASNHHLFRQVNEMDVTPNRLDRKVSYAQNYLDFQFLKEGLQYEFKLRYFCPKFLSLRSHYTVAEHKIVKNWVGCWSFCEPIYHTQNLLQLTISLIQNRSR